jgi:hypothetical protein
MRARGRLRQRTVDLPRLLSGTCARSASDCRRAQAAMTHPPHVTLSPNRIGGLTRILNAF